MNEQLHITDRIDKALNLLQRMPLQGYDQWNPVCEVMRILAGISQDVQKYDAENKPEEENSETE